MKGTVKFFNTSKGFGFITGEDDKDYFVHISKIDNNEELNENDEVDFEPSQNDRGLAANDVKRASGSEAQEE